MPNSSVNYAYTMTRGDYVALCLALFRRPWTKRIAIAVFWLVLVGVILFPPWNDDSGLLLEAFVSGRFPGWYYWFTGGMLTLILFSDRIFPRFSALYYRQIFAADVAFEVTLAPSGIDVQSKDVSGHYAWSSIKQVIETDSHLFLPISKREAVIVPRRAFADQAGFDEARAFARAHVAGKAG